MPTEKKNDGGPVYPSPAEYDLGAGGAMRQVCPGESGMSLRDHFAEQERTLPPCLELGRMDRTVRDDFRLAAKVYLDISDVVDISTSALIRRCLSKWRYQCADAMLEAKDA